MKKKFFQMHFPFCAGTDKIRISIKSSSIYMSNIFFVLSRKEVSTCTTMHTKDIGHRSHVGSYKWSPV